MHILFQYSFIQNGKKLIFAFVVLSVSAAPYKLLSKIFNVVQK